MKSVQIAQLKAKLSEFISIVKSGNEIIVMDRGRPVATLSPFRGIESLQELVKSGQVRPPKMKLPTHFYTQKEASVRDPHAMARKSLNDEREGGF